eukprot:gb/GECG01012271.1/.p1 GENE.gb/GECG01012271.1/~~gb/GECG01012271.1/.p1  ORF type:complete len:132 (+),score=25.78 gb/GECG01012271.1/:1-396(+)
MDVAERLGDFNGVAVPLAVTEAEAVPVVGAVCTEEELEEAVALLEAALEMVTVGIVDTEELVAELDREELDVIEGFPEADDVAMLAKGDTVDVVMWLAVANAVDVAPVGLTLAIDGIDGETIPVGVTLWLI